VHAVRRSISHFDELGAAIEVRLAVQCRSQSLAQRPVQQESVEVSIDPRTRCRLSLDRHPVECGKSRVNASDQRQVTGLDRATAQYLVQCLVRLAFLYSHREALHEKLVSGNAP